LSGKLDKTTGLGDRSRKNQFPTIHPTSRYIHNHTLGKAAWGPDGDADAEVGGFGVGFRAGIGTGDCEAVATLCLNMQLHVQDPKRG